MEKASSEASTREQQARKHLAALFQHKEDHTHILLWTKAGDDASAKKTSHWFSSLNDAQAAAARLIQQDQHVYVGLHTSQSDLGPTRRASRDQVAEVTCLNIDVDISGAAHKSKTLPTDEGEALGVMRQVFPQFPPTLIVRSGNGLHLYWVFKEPYLIEDEKERDWIERLCIQWQAAHRRMADRAGWSLDSTWDLPRVLRLAGSLNVKGGGRRPVTILECNPEFRPDSQDIWEQLESLPPDAFLGGADPSEGAGSARKPSKAARPSGALVFHPDANPNMDKLLRLCELEPRFKATWEGKRTKYPSGQASMSEADYALAYWARWAQWADQEIVNLIIAHRRIRSGAGTPGHVKAYSRRDYILRMLHRLAARASTLEQKDDRQFIAEETPTDAQEHAEQGDKKMQLEHLRKLLNVAGFKVFHRYGESDCLWEVEMMDGRRAMIGTTDKLIRSQHALQCALIEAVNTGTRAQFTKKQWTEVVLAIAATAERHPAFRDLMEDILLDFVSSTLQLGDETRDRMVSQEMTFVHNDALHVRINLFEREVQQRTRQFTTRQVEHALTRMGFEWKKLSYRSGSGRAQRSGSRSYYVCSVNKLPLSIRSILDGTEED